MSVDTLGGPMTPTLPAYAALLLLVGGASARAQSVDQATSPNGTATTPADPVIATPPPPKPRDLLIDMIKTLTQPRDPVAAPAPAAAPVEPLEPTIVSTPAPAAVAPVLPKPVAATPLPRPRRVPPVKLDQAPPPVRVTPPQPLIVTPPLPRPIDPPTPAIVLQPAPPPPLVAEQIEPIVTTPPPPAAWPWLLAGVIVTLAALFTTHQFRRHRRLARTRAAIALTPRIDLSAGVGGPLEVRFARPPLAIRATLGMPAHG